MSVGETVRGMFELTRPVNAVAAGALTFVGAFVAGAGLDSQVAVLAAIGATVLATGAGNAINDYFDRDIDRINQPDRPLPRGAVTPRIALVESGALFAGAVALALLLPPLAIAIAAVNLVALVAYTKLFKGLPGVGNAVVSVLVGSTFLFGGAAVGRIDTVFVLFLLAALATFSRELVKDVEDVTGDREEGLRTVPIVFGERHALVLGAGSLFVAIGASPLPYVLGTFDAAYLVIVVPANVVMAYGSYVSFRAPASGQRYIKLGMFVAVLAFVVGRLATIGVL